MILRRFQVPVGQAVPDADRQVQPDLLLLLFVIQFLDKDIAKLKFL